MQRVPYKWRRGIEAKPLEYTHPRAQNTRSDLRKDESDGLWWSDVALGNEQEQFEAVR